MDRLVRCQVSTASSVRTWLLQVAAALLVVIFCAPVPPSLAGDIDKCAGGVLAKGTGDDLLINAPCTVNTGTYNYHNVNIIKGGSLQFSDKVIDFWAHGILVQNEGSLIPGVVAAAHEGSGGKGVPLGTSGVNP